MNIAFRILLATYAFCLTIISFIFMIVTLKPEFFRVVVTYIYYQVLGNRNVSLALFVTEFVFFILSVLFLLSGFKSNKEKKTISKFTNIGEIKISLNSIENIALNATKKLNSVRETKAYVKKVSEGVLIIVKVVVLPEANIPVLSEDLQLRVKTAVEESSGIKVNEIKILVENVYTGYRSRVD